MALVSRPSLLNELLPSQQTENQNDAFHHHHHHCVVRVDHCITL